MIVSPHAKDGIELVRRIANGYESLLKNQDYRAREEHRYALKIVDIVLEHKEKSKDY